MHGSAFARAEAGGSAVRQPNIVSRSAAITPRATSITCGFAVLLARKLSPGGACAFAKSRVRRTPAATSVCAVHPGRSSVQGQLRLGRERKPCTGLHVRRDVCLPDGGTRGGGARTSGAKPSSGAGGHSDRCQGSRSLLFTAGSRDPSWEMSVAITGASAGCLEVKQPRCAIKQIARSGTSFSAFRSRDFRTQCSLFRNQRAGGPK